MVERSRWSTGAVLGALLGAPACCVCASTPVRTPSGMRRIGELRIGDEVLSLVVDSGELVPTRIVELRTARRECLRLVHAGGELVCTPDHPIYSPESGEYEPASRWVDGARRSVLVIGDAPVAAALVRAEAFAGVHEVVDLTVDDPLHNFVAGGLLVHNKTIDEMLYARAVGPAFVLEADELIQMFEIRACVDGRDPNGDTYGSHLYIDVSARAEPLASMGAMKFAILLEQDGRTLVELDDESIGGHPYIRLDTLADACLSPLSITFERVDGLPDGAIAFTWDLSGATKPPSGTDLEDELVLEVTED